MTKPRKIQAAGSTGINNPPGHGGIDRVLAEKVPFPSTKLGYGRVITTVGSQREINKKVAQGYEILWCQLCKITPSSKTGEIDEG